MKSVGRFQQLISQILGAASRATGAISVNPIGFCYALLGRKDQSLLDNRDFEETSLGVFKLRGTKVGQMNPSIDNTVTATVGAVTIHKAAGRVILGDGEADMVVTNNLVTANSIILLTIAAVDATTTSVYVVADAGSFTITVDAAPAANLPINFLVIN